MILFSLLLLLHLLLLHLLLLHLLLLILLLLILIINIIITCGGTGVIACAVEGRVDTGEGAGAMMVCALRIPTAAGPTV
jgi:hypothetical protein